MNILVVIPYYVPAYSYGGPVFSSHSLNKNLAAKGHKVTVVTTDSYDASSRNSIQKEKIDGVKIIRFRNLSNFLAKNYNAYLPFGFKKWIKNNLKNYDIVHCHDFFTYQNIIISKYAKTYNIPYIIQPHGVLGKGHIKSKNSFLKLFILKRFKRVLKHTKYIIALTETEKNGIQRFVKNSKKIRVIPNGINSVEFRKISKIDLHKKYNLPSDAKLLFYFGRVQAVKGINYIIEMLSKLQSSSSQFNFHFFIIGPDEGGEKARLEKLIKKYQFEKKITFVGQLDGELKKQFIKSCDLYIFLSKGEGLPMTILEVSGLGIPSMLSKECNVPEIAKANGGYEVDKEDYYTNAKLVEEHFKNEKKIKTMQKNAQKVIQDKFELDVVVKKILELYKK